MAVAQSAAASDLPREGERMLSAADPASAVVAVAVAPPRLLRCSASDALCWLPIDGQLPSLPVAPDGPPSDAEVS